MEVTGDLRHSVFSGGSSQIIEDRGVNERVKEVAAFGLGKEETRQRQKRTWGQMERSERFFEVWGEIR